jgi:predicted nucleotidyltransferase
VLGAKLVAAYVHGSLALGAFDPEASDVDFLVATEGDLDAGTVERLAALHERLGERLDGSYLPRDVLRRFDPARRLHPHIESRGGKLALDDHGGETVIYRYVLLKCGITLIGPAPHELIDPVEPDELRAGVRALLREWWQPGGGAWEWFHDAVYRRYAVLTMCRVRYTLTEGDVVSKRTAAEWSLARVDSAWRDLVERAVSRGACGYEETVSFVRATLASCA